MNLVTLFEAGRLQLFLTLLFEFQPNHRRNSIGEIEGDEEGMTFRMNVRQTGGDSKFRSWVTVGM